MHFDEHFLRGALPGVTVIKDHFPEDVTFSIDTRTLQQGDIFVALQGVRKDGHEFLEAALCAGAGGLLIRKEKRKILEAIDQNLLEKKLVIAVDDTLQALTTLASVWRSQFDYPVVAITGSVGKTSTKQIISNILSLSGREFLVSEGNQNTNIGLSLNILKMRSYHTAAVFELGIARRGQMAKLADILQPTTALITGIGHCHMEGLGSLNDIALEKRDVFKLFGEDSIGIINGDQPILAGVGYSHPIIKFGAKTTNQIQARKIKAASDHVDFVLKIYKKKYKIRLPHVHSGAVFNSLAAVAVTHFLGIADDVIVRGIQSSTTVKDRFEQCELKDGKGVMINDCYNANPESMKAALLALEQIDTDAQKIAVLGDMLELGVNSSFWHRQLGRFLRKVPSLKEVILVGDMVEWTKKTVPLGVRAEIVPSWKDAVKKLKSKLADNNVVLVKASRGMHLENVVHHFAAQASKKQVIG